MDVFEDWNARFPRGEGAQHRSALTLDSVFLFEQVTSPRPSPSYFGTWHWYENAVQLKAHLLNVVMPDMASTWLSEGAMGMQVMRQPLSATLDDAMDEWGEDLAFFRAVAVDLERATGTTNEELAREIQAVMQRFTDRFGRTPTWDLALSVFPSTVEAGAYLYERNPNAVAEGADEDLPESGWLALCRKAGVDEEASAGIAAVFEAADEF